MEEKMFLMLNMSGEWQVNTEKVEFDTKRWLEKICRFQRLEITCGEAPYIVSRYDAATGELLEIKQRIGILDRKLRVVNENTVNEKRMVQVGASGISECVRL